MWSKHVLSAISRPFNSVLKEYLGSFNCFKTILIIHSLMASL